MARCETRTTSRTTPAAEPEFTAFVCCLALLVRCATSLHPYSGAGTPPMYGDYEAHRHWMEVTVNLNIGEWYAASADNDLQYWGIDYPPLSAYLSWVVGQLAARTHPQLVALHTSRGHESAPTKLLMRSSVLVVDALVFFPAALALAQGARGGSPTARARCATTAARALARRSRPLPVQLCLARSRSRRSVACRSRLARASVRALLPVAQL